MMKAIDTSAREKISSLRDAIGKTIKGKNETIELAIVALLAEGHLLIEDVPGVGKTTLGHALARSLDCNFHRIQFTSDLLPSDVLGVSVYNPRLSEFEFKRGPIFANIILADEINRTTPKTQSALLEAMNENQVTIENVTYRLPRPFMVLATQNPVEHHGTYPLPESQLDRFLMKIEVGYPNSEAEKEILKRFSNGSRGQTVEPVLTPDDVTFLQDEGRKIHINGKIVDYMIQVVHRTRNHPDIELGISPRGTVALFRTAQALGLVAGRNFVLPDDIKRAAVPVFAHRLALARRGTKGSRSKEELIASILSEIPVPD